MRPSCGSTCPGRWRRLSGCSRSSTASTTLGFLAAGVALLAAFAAVERRVAEPLLPLRVVLDCNRGGSYLAVGIVGVGVFGSFFFLTFCLQQTLGYSPIETGFAVLPQVAAIMATATTSSTVLLPRTGPRPLVILGLLLGRRAARDADHARGA